MRDYLFIYDAPYIRPLKLYIGYSKLSSFRTYLINNGAQPLQQSVIQLGEHLVDDVRVFIKTFKDRLLEKIMEDAQNPSDPKKWKRAHQILDALKESGSLKARFVIAKVENIEFYKWGDESE